MALDSIPPCILPIIVIAAIGIVLNSIASFMLMAEKQRQPTHHLIISKSLSDILISVASLFIILSINPTKPYNIFLFSLTFFSFLTSTISTILISFDRLFAVCFPFRYKELASPKRLRNIVLLNWILCLAIGIVFAVRQYVSETPKQFWYAMTFLIFIAASALVIVYSMICVSIRRNNEKFRKSFPGTSNSQSIQSRRIQERRFFLYSLCVVFSYLSCNLFYCIVLFIYGDHLYGCTGQGLYSAISIILINFNVVCDPILYFFVALPLKMSCICFRKSKVTADKDEDIPTFTTLDGNHS